MMKQRNVWEVSKEKVRWSRTYILSNTKMRWERVVEASLMEDVTVNDLQYGFMQKQMQGLL